MTDIGHVVFCPPKTASYSIVRSWSLLQAPVLHTHDLHHFVVFDKKNSRFFQFVREHFGVRLDLVVEIPDGMIQYTVEIRDHLRIRFLFNFFDFRIN